MASPVLLEVDPQTGMWRVTSPVLPGFIATASTRRGALQLAQEEIAVRRTFTYDPADHSDEAPHNGTNGAIAVYESGDQLSFALSLLDEVKVNVAPRGSHRIAFGWYGGKYSHLDWLLPLLPFSNHYCEPYGGSAAVLINRPASPVETYNDLDGEVVNFFEVLRGQRDELVEAILLTPFSREELTRACRQSTAALDPLERARRFYIRARQTRTGLAQTASPGRWATCRNTSRRGMGGAVSRWLGGAPDLLWIAARLLRVQIDNRPAEEVIRAYDTRNTLFYCDPPYPHESRGDSKAYAFEMTDAEHRRLATVLHGILGRAAVSGYRCNLMDELYSDWNRFDAPAKPCHSTKEMRQEALWTNYDATGERIDGPH